MLSRRLYGFGSVPRSPRWDPLVGSADDVAGLLGLEPGGRARGSAGYEAVANPHWLAWSRADEGADARPELPFKLYFSPRPEALVECFPDVVGILAEHGVWSFKVGRGVLGLLRPDKVVAYLEDFDRLERLAGALAGALDGCPAHGVPFTVEASPDGLLSWGMDPPSAERLVGARPGELAALGHEPARRRAGPRSGGRMHGRAVGVRARSARAGGGRSVDLASGGTIWPIEV